LSLVLIPCSVWATDYHVAANLTKTIATNTTPLGDYDLDGATTTGSEVHFDDPNMPTAHTQANSQGGPDGLHARAFAASSKDVAGGPAFNYSLSSTAFVQGTWTDVVISGPAGSGPIPVSFNVHLDGSDSTPSVGGIAATTVQLVFFGNDNNIGGGSQSDQTNFGVQQPTSATGSLIGFDGDDVIASPTFNAPVNTPFSIALQLSAFAAVQASNSDAFSSSATSDFDNTLTFATDRPVFNLPDGFTASSADAAIVNNTFVVPEPTAALSLLPAIAGVLRRRRR